MDWATIAAEVKGRGGLGVFFGDPVAVSILDKVSPVCCSLLPGVHRNTILPQGNEHGHTVPKPGAFFTEAYEGK